MRIKKIHFDNMDYSAVYLHPSNLKGLITSHSSRPIIKITCDGKSIYRKLRSKTIDGLDGNSIGIDHVSLIELNASDGDSIGMKNANLFERFVTYYYKNPNEDIRGAWWYFVIGIIVSGISMVF